MLCTNLRQANYSNYQARGIQWKSITLCGIYGWPSTIISDNGKSSVGTEKDLGKLVEEGRKQIEEFAVLHRICWIFTTSLSPHQGGIYESLIKQTKNALEATVDSQLLPAEVECFVNSRRLGYPSNDPSNP